VFVAAVTLLMFVLPLASVALDVGLNSDHGALIDGVGKWFVFWAVGARLFTAGVTDRAPEPDVRAHPRHRRSGRVAARPRARLRERGDRLGRHRLAVARRVAGAGALAGGLFLLLAGVEHLVKRERGFEARLAMVSDLAIGAVMACHLVA
jgi:hypothetical protein